MPFSENSSILSLLIFFPILGVLALLFLGEARPAAQRFVAIIPTLGTLCCAILILCCYDASDSAMQYMERGSWWTALGVNYVVGVDSLSLWLVILTSLLTFLVILASVSVSEGVRGYLLAIMLLQIGMNGTFLSLEAVTFYVFWEWMLIPMYFLIGIWGGKRRHYAAYKFVMFTAFGSLLMLVAIAYLGYQHFVQYGYWNFELSRLKLLDLSVDEGRWLFAAFALAFLIKVPAFPFHTWLPDAHVEAPTGGSVILAGVLLKMGLYGLFRFGIPLFPEAVVSSGWVFMVLGVIGIIYGALVAWMQTDMKKLVAYSSVSHMGFCLLGFGALNFQGLQGSMLQMLNHGLSTAALFFLVGVLYDRKHSREIVDYQGLASKVPVYAAVFLLVTFSSIGLPLTNGFVGEFLILLGASKVDLFLTGFAVTGVILGAVYMLSLYRRVFFGTLNEERNGDLLDLTLRERLVFVPLLAGILWIGIFPGFILRSLEGSSLSLLEDLRRAKSEPAQIVNFLDELPGQ